ncbi:MAG: hypothetical protein J6L76_07635 [Clostridia bacterium]|nr:hypothetical protein [Clostridia bacterium]
MSNRAHAYKYEYDNTLEAPENFVPVEKPIKQNVVLTEIRNNRARRKMKNGILVKISLLIVLGLCVALRYASITELNYRNQALQKTYEDKVARVQQQQVNMDSQMSIAEIAQIAQDRLGMQKPQPYQIVEIQTETIDQTEMVSPEYTKDTAKIPWYEKIWNHVLSFFGFA